MQSVLGSSTLSLAQYLKAQLAGDNASWYWPVADRLLRSDYTAPAPIRIAQADTGVSK